jgi:nucleoside-diphosphate-sugar epimerase
MRKVIITGVTGFIGGALARRLLSDGVRVYGVGRDTGKLEVLKSYGDFVPVAADFADYGRLHEIIGEYGFDMFYHLAWNGTSASAPVYNDYNVQVLNIKAACDAANSAVTLRCNNSSSSSSYQQGNISISDTDGDELFNPIIYGITKRCAAEMFKAIAYKNKMSCVNLIFPNTYGPGDKLNTAIVFFLKNMLLNKPLNLISGLYKDDWMYIDDLIDGILSASQSQSVYKDYYIGHRNITSFKDKLIKMKDTLNSNSELLFGTYPENYYVNYQFFDLDALYNDTGWEANTDFGETIQKTAEWIKSAIHSQDPFQKPCEC